MMSKWFYIVFGVYVVLYCTVLNQYIAPSYKYLDYYWFVPTALLGVLFIPPVTRFLNKIANADVWAAISIAVMVACAVLQLSGIKGVWGSLPSVGFVFATIVLVMHLTRGRLARGKSLLLGCGCAWVAEGGTELLYRIGYLIYHDYPGGVQNFWVQFVQVVLWWVIPGAVIMVLLGKNLPHNTTLFTVGVVLAVALTSAWYLSGFKTVDFYTGHESFDLVISRCWRAACCLAPALLFAPIRKEAK